MAYGQIQQFYINHDQFKLMCALCRHTTLSINEIAKLRWDDITSPLCRKAKLDRELFLKMFRLQHRAKKSTVPFEYVFYKELPTRKNPCGLCFTPEEIWEICGKPSFKKPKKVRRNLLTLPHFRLIIESKDCNFTAPKN